MKIRLLTFHCAKNYGAALQAFALLKTLKIYAQNTEIINYRPCYITKSYMSNKDVNGVLPLIKFIFLYLLHYIRYYMCGGAKKVENFTVFERDYLNINEHEVYVDVPRIMSDIDCVFFGSDQIWNVRITNFDAAYIGEIQRSPSCRLVAYAASIGNDISSDNEREFIAKYLNNFYKISVRESTAKKLQDKYRKDIDVVLDPVFLLSKNQWKNIAVPCHEKKYVLLYNMGNNDLVTQIGYKVASLLGLSVVEIFAGGRSLKKIYHHKIYPSAGPREFVGLISEASFVVTSSFHGTAFSIIFEKQWL